MDIEKLKLILETVNAAGEGAYSIAIFWLARELLVNVLWWGAFVYVAYRVTKLFIDLAASASLKRRLEVAMQPREGAWVDLSADTRDGNKNRDKLVAFVRTHFEQKETKHEAPSDE